MARKAPSRDRAQRRRRPFTGALCQRHVIKIERERPVHGSEDGTKEKGVGGSGRRGRERSESYQWVDA